MFVTAAGRSGGPDGSPPRERVPDQSFSSPAEQRIVKQNRTVKEYAEQMCDGRR